MSLIPVLVEDRVKSGNFGHQEIRTAALFVSYFNYCNKEIKLTKLSKQ